MRCSRTVTNGRRAGFDLERLGPQTLVVRSVPALLPREDIAALVRDVVGDVTSDGASHHLDGATDRLFGTIACRSAIHAHRRLTLAGDERAAAPDGADAARRPVQSRPADLDPGDAAGARPHVPARALKAPRRVPELQPPRTTAVLTGPTGAGKTDFAAAPGARIPARDRERRFRAGVSRSRHRQRQAGRGRARRGPASPDRSDRADAELFRRPIRARRGRAPSRTSKHAGVCRCWWVARCSTCGH